MIHQILKDKPTKLFLGITAFFVANALIAECIGGKIFSLESVFGFKPMNMTLFGESGLAFNLTCGVLLWPLEFVITDIVNEYYGPKAVRRISLIAVALISYAFIMFYLAMSVAPAGFWVESKMQNGVPSMQLAFEAIFGQYKDHKNAYAQIYNTVLQRDIANMKNRKYNSSLESYLFSNNIPMDVYKKFEEVLSSEITIDKIEFTNGFLNIYLN